MRMALVASIVFGCITGCAANDDAANPQSASASIQVQPRTLDETLSTMKGFIEREVTAGFSSEDEIVVYAVEVFTDEQDAAVLRPAAERFAQEAIARHLEKQAAWPAVTDCDRLDSAFAELEQRGILSRQDFSDCGTCGVAEIWDEIKKAQSEGRKVKGYTFYHQQDTESAAVGDGLYLNYGAVDEDEEAAVKIAREIVEVLSQNGLGSDWDGTWETRIAINLDWKRRR